MHCVHHISIENINCLGCVRLLCCRLKVLSKSNSKAFYGRNALPLSCFTIIFIFIIPLSCITILSEHSDTCLPPALLSRATPRVGMPDNWICENPSKSPTKNQYMLIPSRGMVSLILLALQCWQRPKTLTLYNMPNSADLEVD